MEINGDTTSIVAVNLILRSIALVVQCTIGMIAFRKMSSRRHIGTKVITSFLFSFISASCFTITVIAWELLNLWNQDLSICIALWVVSGGSFFLSLLWTLILRLKLTFNDSAYRMSSTMSTIFIVILLSLFLAFVVVSILVFFMSYSDWLLIFYITFIAGLCPYFIGSALAVYFFVNNLLKIARAQATVLSEDYVIGRDVSMDLAVEKQQKLSDLAARYMMLFIIAVTSTSCTNIIALLVNDGSSWRNSIYAFDSCVNLWCIFLQEHAGI